MDDRDMQDEQQDESAVKDAVTGEELKTFTMQAADGREIVVNARDEETARAAGREQAGGIGILSIKEGAEEGDADEDNEFTGAADPTDDPFADPDGDDVTFAPAASDDPSTPHAGEAVNPDARNQPQNAPAAAVARADSQAPQSDATYGTDASPDGNVSGENVT